MFTYTNEQAAVIAALWNQAANAENQITADNVHVIFHDNADDDLAERGHTLIEIRAAKTKSGNPETFEITAEMVELEAVE